MYVELLNLLCLLPPSPLYVINQPHSHRDVCLQLPFDAHILRFLRAREFHIDKAREMLCRSLAWRKRYGVDKLLATYRPCDVMRRYYAGGWHHHDKGEYFTCTFCDYRY